MHEVTNTMYAKNYSYRYKYKHKTLYSNSTQNDSRTKLEDFEPPIAKVRILSLSKILQVLVKKKVHRVRFFNKSFEIVLYEYKFKIGASLFHVFQLFAENTSEHFYNFKEDSLLPLIFLPDKKTLNG